MKRVFVTLPMLWPRLSDQAAAQLLEIMSQLLEAVQHHYGPQAWRWQRQQGRRRPVTSSGNAPPALADDDPF
jgi:hypothetical protein